MTLAVLDTWQALMSPRWQALRDAAATVDAGDVSAVAHLRRLAPPNLVTAALQLAAGRRSAAGKFPASGDLVLDDAGAQQASSSAVAAWKAKRFVEQLEPAATVIDLCCGIGGDARALAAAGLHVLAVDREPVRAWMAKCNAHCATAAADVTQLRLAGLPFHIDPARRNARGRVWRIADYQPGLTFLRRLLAASPDGGMKLSPGVDREEADALAPGAELEFISEAGRLVQAVLWTGKLRRAVRSATMVTDHATHTLQGSPAAHPLQFAPPGRYLFTMNASVERAELMGLLAQQLNTWLVHPHWGLLSADQIVSSPWTQAFELFAELPWRPKKVRQWLDSHDGGIVEVKTRGKAIDPDLAQAQLRGRGDSSYTVFVLRQHEQKVALITRRADR
ncbi:hypothetical protein ACERK3_18885 [Phycisphaerales bacterium AB-hyl4]|uniref:THUMP-like domain-containing protein n=1 Tax=Natronomicrosphaera hydrolytica TaxID=3242702 RepID=A0ABV4UBR5_9BACT